MKRLKIAEQMIIVIILAVLIPSITIGFIITNVSQQSMRKELIYSATTLAQYIGDTMNNYLAKEQENLNDISLALSSMNNGTERKNYINKLNKNSKDFQEYEIINIGKAKKDFYFDDQEKVIKMYSPINETIAVMEKNNAQQLGEIIGEKFAKEKRHIYIVNKNNDLLDSNIDDTSDFENVIKELPKKLIKGEAEKFGYIKNQPMAYYSLENPEITVIVNTTERVTKSTINLARFRIILAITLSGLFIIILMSLYTSYLYINIKQLFKGIIAISKGSYDRKIHLIKNIFTPHEIVFLAKEFNFMAKKVAQSHKELYQKNMELQMLDNFRSHLVSAISHEFRTPLTSIVGYSSRLLRQDIEIDEETKTKSLKIIKQQAQRLSRMVEDLLVVPDIESFRLQLKEEEIDLSKLIADSIFYANPQNKPIETEISNNLKPVFVDKDRMTQILVNLCDNAIKYSENDTPVKITADLIDEKNVITITNSHSDIPKEQLDKLFDKFIRLDTELTRTTRGTGLGLFIVKGLANAMNIDVFLNSEDNKFKVTLVFNEKIVEEEIEEDDE